MIGAGGEMQQGVLLLLLHKVQRNPHRQQALQHLEAGCLGNSGDDKTSLMLLILGIKVL